MGWLGDAWDAIIDVAEEIPVVNGLVEAGRALEEFVPGFIDDVGDVLEDPIDYIGSGLETIGEGLAGFGALVLSPVAFAGDALDTVTFGGASWVMDQVDEYVFDNVDWATGGAIDIDFDNGAFSVDLGMNEVASLGFSIGESGFTADGYIAGLGAGVGMTEEEGFTVDLKADLPFVDEVGVGVGLDFGDGDDAFFLDVDGRVLGGDDDPADPPAEPPADPADETVPGEPEDGGDAPPPPDEPFPTEVEPFVAAAVELPEPTIEFDAPDTEFARDVAEVDAVTDATDDVWNDLG